ncbi:MAG: biosynthetic arginine decarboxylase [Gammaproteobacteria bacterium]|nr:biosynthetic arginine decarboxylase [Gammaproteobacteria bacterium]
MFDWNIQKARDLYNIAHWGNGYFDINARGHLIARPDPTSDHPGIDLYELTREFARNDLALPVLVRFSGILQHRVRELWQAFDSATVAHNYSGRYTAVYPIKVNQQRSVVDALLEHGGDRLGLEAGSKPELLAVLARARPNAIVVCNGYKDREYIRLALIGKAIGHRVHIVVEKLSELESVLAEAKQLGITPLVGVRVRLSSIGVGKWQNTGGDKSKFGLTSSEALRCVARLREAGQLGALQMLHFHMGSQIANVQHIQSGMREAARYYAELCATGADIRIVNVGGGLGVDYEGTRSRSFCSMNYSVAEYANNVVHALAEICAEKKLRQPDIVTESGRAMTAHHAVLITNVIDCEQAPGRDSVAKAEPNEPAIIGDMWQAYAALSSRSAIEAYHDAANYLSQAQGMFTHGVLTLEQRSRAEQIYFAICWKVRELLAPSAKAHREVLDELNEKLADKYFCNFSLFQSMPDHWAIEQIFPMLPLSRLDEPPTRRAVLQDITCDSDGRVDQYVSAGGVDTTLPLHAPRDNEPYLIGMFMVGAYQEILGDLHNLFGDTDSVHVELTADGGHRLVAPCRGDTVDSVLRFVHFDPEDLLAAYRQKVGAVTGVDAKQRELYFTELAAGLEGYTYLED